MPKQHSRAKKEVSWKSQIRQLQEEDRSAENVIEIKGKSLSNKKAVVQVFTEEDLTKEDLKSDLYWSEQHNQWILKPEVALRDFHEELIIDVEIDLTQEGY